MLYNPIFILLYFKLEIVHKVSNTTDMNNSKINGLSLPAVSALDTRLLNFSLTYVLIGRRIAWWSMIWICEAMYFPAHIQVSALSRTQLARWVASGCQIATSCDVPTVSMPLNQFAAMPVSNAVSHLF